MTVRTLAIATALTSATAFGAYADDQGMSGDHAGINNETDAFYEMGVEYEMDGMRAMNLDTPDLDDPAVRSDTSDKPDASRAADSAPENILAVAEKEARVWTSDNAPIGTVYKTTAMGEDEHLVYVEVAEDANLPVDLVAFPVDSLRVANEGVRLEHHARMDDLRAETRDAVQG